ncbi:GGDEF domain-containing protein [Helicobacter sp. MIT 14-3879]|uniref:GGDEF domain-containing protein n=1 Tax=Helicobacter sp. MIT 14-3879 TaxID=2040649 RepID=UPI000E1F7283|nr:diguanylate cyclase [Helicobacter sp. MIT 14-3879]RDU62457.1 GGDEF domain-containing protein [Helicobacter sp. MIT 14-3879]
MLTFKWNKSYVTNIDTIDEQHKMLVNMINKLGESIFSKERLSVDILDKYFENLALYAKVHFRDEEVYMSEFNVDERHQNAHKHAHNMFLQEAAKLYEAVKNDLIGPEFLFHFLANWISIHILGTDKILAKQINFIKQGKSPKNAFDSVQEIVDETVAPLLYAVNQLFSRTTNMNHRIMSLNKSLEEQVKARTEELQKVNNTLKAMALTDSLTELGNRRAAVAYLQNEWKKPFDDRVTITCIMIDIDKFKHINDTQGHECGDKVLKIVARAIRDSVRNDDFVCRLGGDEFVVLSNNTNLTYIMKLAEHIRLQISQIRLEFPSDVWEGSISLGVAQRDDSTKTYIDLLKKADEGLYLAKQAGRNQIGCV